MLSVEFSPIYGVAIGAEYVSPADTDSDYHHIIVDLVIIRLLFAWPA